MKKKLVYIFGIGAVLLAGFLSVTNTHRPVVKETESVQLHDGDTFTLVASEVEKFLDGRNQSMLAYNGSIPGPTIVVDQGASIKINFVNSTKHVQLLHAHGVRMDNKFDGSQLVQEPMKPGDKFTYTLTFPDAGVFWYHPHASEVVQQSLGLYGAFLVRPKENNMESVNAEVPVFLSDILLGAGGSGVFEGDTSHTLMGTFGNVMLTNGQTSYHYTTNKGSVVRMYFINSANARPFNVSISGAKMKIVGSDAGLYETPFFAENVILSPSERAIVDVYFPESGEYKILHTTPVKSYELGSVIVQDTAVVQNYSEDFLKIQSLRTVVSSIDPYRPYFDSEPTKRLLLIMGTMGMGHMMHDVSPMSQVGDGIDWEEGAGMMMNMKVPWQLVDLDTGKVNMDIAWKFKKDVPEKIRIVNDPNSMHPMQHPFHFHGQRFLVLARNGIHETNLVWKDTVMVKAGETVDILLDPANVGSWMAHCHISDHLFAGMMLGFTVE